MLRIKLESENIPCFLFDENIVALNPLYNIMVGGIKLKVREENSLEALQIIAVYDKALSTDIDGKKISCPKCNSEEIIFGFK